jgi:hypothetical protein
VIGHFFFLSPGVSRPIFENRGAARALIFFVLYKTIKLTITLKGEIRIAETGRSAQQRKGSTHEPQDTKSNE